MRTGRPRRSWSIYTAHADAHRAVGRAIRAGVLPPPTTCCLCGLGPPDTRGAVVYHHWSYLPVHELQVAPLCRLCHLRVHAGVLPEPVTGRWHPRRARLAHVVRRGERPVPYGPFPLFVFPAADPTRSAP